MNSIEFLKETAPNWVDTNSLIADEIQLVANSQLPSGAPGNRYCLRISETKGKLRVKEHPEPNVLPLCCIERHINDDGTFCTFYGSNNLILHRDAAIEWWGGLKQFLSDQEFASKHQKWPGHRSMSHGDAADIQLRMEEIALKNDWIEETLSGMFRKTGWLGGAINRVRKNSALPVNQRGPCPRGCLYCHTPSLQKDCANDGCADSCKKKHNPVLLADCPNRSAINELILLENQRRKRELAYVQSIAKKGIQCCGTMDGCPLSVTD